MQETKELARRIRKQCLMMANRGKSSHIASALSVTDILAVLYGKVMNYSIKDINMPDRDIFILSKGHAGSAVYATLAEVGFLDSKVLETHYQNGSILSGHVSHKSVPGVEFSTGSLGHGLGVATGFALSFKKKNNKRKVYVVLSDGECDEGSNWEAILFAAHNKLNNLTVIIDYNKIQGIDRIENTINLEPFADKWSSFNWHTVEVDGNDHQQLIDAFEVSSDKPKVIIANTVKGKGVSFMEDKIVWHYRWPRDNEVSNAIDEINKREI